MTEERASWVRWAVNVCAPEPTEKILVSCDSGPFSTRRDLYKYITLRIEVGYIIAFKGHLEHLR